MVENVNWTVGESNHINFYVGLSRLVIDSDITQIGNFTVPTYIEWDSESCDSGYCNDCENAANNVISSLIVAFITCKYSLCHLFFVFIG